MATYWTRIGITTKALSLDLTEMSWAISWIFSEKFEVATWIGVGHLSERPARRVVL